MDFTTNRSVPTSASRTTNAGPQHAPQGGKKDGRWQSTPKWLKLSWVTLLFAGTVLLVAIIALLLFNPREENEIVSKSKYQAVFLDNGQVYFGKINAITETYVDMQGIYYLNVSQPVQPKQQSAEKNNNITLQKLGCELHGPADQMIINREHVTFWENLREDGKVAQAIAQWLTTNPNGLKCEEPQPSTNGNGQNTNTENKDENTQE